MVMTVEDDNGRWRPTTIISAMYGLVCGGDDRPFYLSTKTNHSNGIETSTTNSSAPSRQNYHDRQTNYSTWTSFPPQTRHKLEAVPAKRVLHVEFCTYLRRMAINGYWDRRQHMADSKSWMVSTDWILSFLSE
jgi:hypothetical protein